MARFIEIVLDIAVPAVRDWAGQKKDGSRRRGKAPAFVQLLGEALPQLERADGDSVARIESVCFDNGSALVHAGWRVAIEASADAQRATVWHFEPFSPGVMIRSAVFDVAIDAPGDASSDAAPSDGAHRPAGLAAISFDDAPAAFREALAMAGQLQPAATLAFARTRWTWPRQDGVVIDVTLDADMGPPDRAEPCLHELRLSIALPDEPDDPGSGPGGAVPAAAWQALFAAARDALAALPAFVQLTDYADRTCRNRVGAALTAVRAGGVDLSGARTQREALAIIGRNVAEHWFGNETGVRDAADTEFVHQMRVAQRRLRTAMRLFKGWADEAWADRIEPDLKWLGKLLGNARDRDVFVDSTLPALANADTDAARWAATREAADVQRLAARAKVQEAMASRRYANLALAWLEWQTALLSREAPPNAARQSLAKHAKKRIRKPYRRLVETPKLTTIDEKARHSVRIEAKRLRYALEFLESIVSRKTRVEVAKTLSRIQSVLGDGNDAAVALGYLDELNVDAYQRGFARGWCEAVKRYTAREGERLLRDLDAPKIVGGDG